MDSFCGEDGFAGQSASALPFNLIGGATRSYPEGHPMESRAQETFQEHSGLEGRGLYSKERWEAHKPTIKQLYIVENKPFKRVIDILRTEHNFFPTYVITSFVYAIQPWQNLIC
jgi:hypothetical protein